MEGITLDPDTGQLLVGDLDSVPVAATVDFATDFQTSRGGRRCNQVDDGRMGQERLASPVLGDEREKPVLDLVPLARARRQVAHRDCQAGLVCKLLQFEFPEPHPRPVASASVSSHQ